MAPSQEAAQAPEQCQARAVPAASTLKAAAPSLDSSLKPAAASLGVPAALAEAPSSALQAAASLAEAVAPLALQACPLCRQAAASLEEEVAPSRGAHTGMRPALLAQPQAAAAAPSSSAPQAQALWLPQDQSLQLLAAQPLREAVAALACQEARVSPQLPQALQAQNPPQAMAQAQSQHVQAPQ